MTNEMIEAAFVVLLILMALGLLTVFILLIVAVFKIQKNTRQAAANIVITNKKLVEIRKLLAQNFGETQTDTASDSLDEEPSDAGNDDLVGEKEI